MTILSITDGKDADRIEPSDKKHHKLSDVIIRISSRTYSAEDGARYFKATDVYRTKRFLKAFVEYNPPTSTDLKLNTIK